MKELQVGFVGLHRGGGHIRSFGGHPKTKIAAFCDVDEDVLADVGRQYDVPDDQLFTRYEDLLNAPIDIVVVATPIEYHAEQAIAAMESGRHVLCEQVAAYTIADCERLIDTVKRTGQTYMMGENFSYYPYILEWKKMVAQGRLGKVFHAEAEYLHEIVHLLVDPETGERKWRYTRAPIWYCGHALGPLMTVMDDRIVKATGAHSGKNTFPNEEGIGFLDMELGLFKTEKGATVKILSSQVAKRYGKNASYMCFYSLYGTEGFVESGRDGGGDTEGLMYIEGEMTKQQGAQVYPTRWSDPDAPEQARLGGHGTTEYYMVRDFIDAIESNTRPPFDVIRSVEITIPGILAHEAAMSEGVWLDVPLYEW